MCPLLIAERACLAAELACTYLNTCGSFCDSIGEPTRHEGGESAQGDEGRYEALDDLAKR